MPELELKPCPFCGGEAKLNGDDYIWFRCTNCGAETMGDENLDIAVEQWNNRVSDQ